MAPSLIRIANSSRHSSVGGRGTRSAQCEVGADGCGIRGRSRRPSPQRASPFWGPTFRQSSGVCAGVVLAGGAGGAGDRLRHASHAPRGCYVRPHVGWVALAVGIAGMLLVRNLIYAALFIAPLACAGLGLLLIMNRMVDREGGEQACGAIVPALGGFSCNLGLTLAHHTLRTRSSIRRNARCGHRRAGRRIPDRARLRIRKRPPVAVDRCGAALQIPRRRSRLRTAYTSAPTWRCPAGDCESSSSLARCFSRRCCSQCRGTS